MIKAVIFDFGGVVMEEKSSATEILAEVYDENVERIKEIARPYLLQMSAGKCEEKDCYVAIGKILNKPVPENVEELWDKRVSDDKNLYPEIIQLVRRLKLKGIRTVVLSNSIPPFARRNKAMGLYRDFDSYYLSCDIGFRKPDLEAYKYVLDNEHFEARECLFIDDKEKNIETAKSLGMGTILAHEPKQVIREVERLVS